MRQRIENAGRTQASSQGAQNFFTRAFARASSAVRKLFEGKLLDEWREKRVAKKTETTNSLCERTRKGELEAVKKLVEMSEEGRNEEIVEAFRKAGTLAFSQLAELLVEKKHAHAAKVLLVKCSETSVFAVEQAIDELIAVKTISGRQASQLIRLERVLESIRQELITRRAVAQARRENARAQAGARAREQSRQAMERTAEEKRARRDARREEGRERQAKRREELTARFAETRGSGERTHAEGREVEFTHEDGEKEVEFEPDAEFSERLQRADAARLLEELAELIRLLPDEKTQKPALDRMRAIVEHAEHALLVFMILEDAVRQHPDARVKKLAAGLLLELSKREGQQVH
ncbi:hypothetical protein HY992_05690 [Candidatus Micrarchaeota archaeon]|nr:hypothetical protein [Candidatus Micrarchaeota archaeon]